MTELVLAQSGLQHLSLQSAVTTSFNHITRSSRTSLQHLTLTPLRNLAYDLFVFSHLVSLQFILVAWGSPLKNWTPFLLDACPSVRHLELTCAGPSDDLERARPISAMPTSLPPFLTSLRIAHTDVRADYILGILASPAVPMLRELSVFQGGTSWTRWTITSLALACKKRGVRLTLELEMSYVPGGAEDEDGEEA